MAYLTPKPKKASAWISSQVVYGMDCSDPDPANWKPFGSAVEEAKVRHVPLGKPADPPKTQ